MVSKASDDLPEPLRPVITVSVFRGISTEMFFRLCWRAPRTVILLIAMDLMNLGKRRATDLKEKPGLTVVLKRSVRSSTPYVKCR